MNGDQMGLVLAGAFFVLIAAIGIGFGLSSDSDLTRAEAVNDRLRHDLATALRTLADNGVEHHGDLAEAHGALAAQQEDLIEAARRIKRHGIARRHAEEQLAKCRCTWPADEPTVDLATDGVIAQIEQYLAEQGDGS